MGENCTRTPRPSWAAGDLAADRLMTDSQCEQCQSGTKPLFIFMADFGDGAMLAVLCAECLHRLQYRKELERRLRLLELMKAVDDDMATP